jgi:hypothetical protein
MFLTFFDQQSADLLAESAISVAICRIAGGLRLRQP